MSQITQLESGSTEILTKVSDLFARSLCSLNIPQSLLSLHLVFLPYPECPPPTLNLRLLLQINTSLSNFLFQYPTHPYESFQFISVSPFSGLKQLKLVKYHSPLEYTCFP